MADDKKSKVEEPKVEDPRKLYFRVKVNHLIAEGKSRENPIPVNDLGDQAHGRAVCYPNQEAILSQVQINILKEAVERTRMAVPEDSGILEETNPIAAAKKQFPGYDAVRDSVTGGVILVKERPRFAVEVIGPYTPKK